MKPTLVIGMGNSLMGDDGVGWHVAQRLAIHPALPDTVEVVAGGTDLLRLAIHIEGRERIVVIDARQSVEPPGSVHVYTGSIPGDASRRHCHDLSLVEAVQLLRNFVRAPIVLMTVSVSSAAMGAELSAAVSACLPSILGRALEETRAPDLGPSISDSHVL
jgi:hydrogenase maturation protease